MSISINNFVQISGRVAVKRESGLMPSDITGNQILWFDADATDPLVDQFGVQTASFTPPTATSPQFNIDPNAANKTVCYFQNSSARLRMTPFNGYSSGTTTTQFTVFETGSPATQVFGVTNNRLLGVQYNQSSTPLYIQRFENNSIRWEPTPSLSGFNIHVAQTLPNSAWVNGSSETVVNNFGNGGATGTATGFGIGDFTITGSGSAFTPVGGSLAELIVYDRALSNLERETIEGYLAHKWNLTSKLPVSHPYKTTAP